MHIFEIYYGVGTKKLVMKTTSVDVLSFFQKKKVYNVNP